MRLPCGPSTTIASTSPMRIAFMVASDSARRTRTRSSSTRKSRPAWFFPARISHLCFALQIQFEKYALAVRQVADDPPQGKRGAFDQGRCGYDPLVPGQSWFLMNVDDLQIVSSLQVLPANGVNVQ